MTSTAWLIMSGAYVEQELAAEFGQLPPAFLPVGLRRLYEYQVDSIGPDHPIYLTIPDGFEVPPHDAIILATAGVSVLSLPRGLSLGEAVVFALNLIGGIDMPVSILHGDTLVGELPTTGADWVGVSRQAGHYSWAEVQVDENNYVVGLQTVAADAISESAQSILCGLFCFAHSAGLVRAITLARGDFVRGILNYAQSMPVVGIPVAGWSDFGHVQTYFRSRLFVTSARYFNQIKVNSKTVCKTSKDGSKIRAEAAWFIDLPPSLRIYTARLIQSGVMADGQEFYETEYSYLPTLAELFVFGKVGRVAWTKIMQCCQEFLSACATIGGEAPIIDTLEELGVKKIVTRLQAFAMKSGFDIDSPLRFEEKSMPSLTRIVENLAEHINLKSTRRMTVMHGDFCFSNILYDSRVDRIRVIDPRGCIRDGQQSIFGDSRYDLAKLSHSIIGRYDQIIAGRYTLEANDRQFAIAFEPALHQGWLESALNELVVDQVCAANQDIKALTVGLFISMLPLHSDRPDRQRAFIANALRLYSDLNRS